MTSAIDTTSQMNSSLSDLLEIVDDDFNDASSPFCKEGETITTKDSMGSGGRQSKKKLPGTKKATKRGAKKNKKLSDDAAEGGSVDHSLSNLLQAEPQHHGKHDAPTVATMDSVNKHKGHKSPKSRRGGKRTSINKKSLEQLGEGDNSESGSLDHSLSHLLEAEPHRHSNDAPTVATMDSVHNKHKGHKSPLSRRGGKRTSINKKTDLESSLSEMLHDPDDDDDDAAPAASPRRPRESGTVDTLDSLPRHKNNSGSGSRSKRGGKRGGGDLSLTGGPAPAMGLAGALDKLGGQPRDFGRQADDNDTFCGLGTVGESELQKQPLSKQSPRKSCGSSGSKAKSKVVMPSPSKKKSVAAPKPFMMSLSNDDDDDSEEEEDLFQNFGANPFRTPYQ